MDCLQSILLLKLSFIVHHTNNGVVLFAGLIIGGEGRKKFRVYLNVIVTLGVISCSSDVNLL